MDFDYLFRSNVRRRLWRGLAGHSCPEAPYCGVSSLVLASYWLACRGLRALNYPL